MSKLTKNQERFLLALLDSQSTGEAIKRANISKTSAYKWLNDPTFKTEYKRMRREIMKQVTGRLQLLALKATTKLEEVLDDPNATNYAVIQASQLILEKAYKGLELEDLEERIEALENMRNVNEEQNEY